MSDDQEHSDTKVSAQVGEAGQADSAVGYGKPPVAHQYKKGFSGNPKGRPKKRERAFSARQFNTDIFVVANEVITIVVNGKKIRVTLHEAVARRLYIDGARGHFPSAKLAMQISKDAGLERAHMNGKFHVRLEETELTTAYVVPYPPNENFLGFLDYEREISRQI